MGLLHQVRRLALLAATALAFLATPSFAQSAPGTELPPGTPAPVETTASGIAALAPKPGSVAEAISKFLEQFSSFRSGLISAATNLSASLDSEAKKIAFGLGVITLTLAAIQFASTSDPTAAWTGFLETLLVLAIFSTLFVGYTSFGPGIFEWFKSLADKITGTRSTDAGLVLATVAGSFIDSFNKVMGAARWYEAFGVAIAGILLILAFLACGLAACLYSFYMILGEIQVAIGIVIGPIAVALGFSDYTRRFFNSWLDYMITGSMYILTAAIMGRLIASAVITSLNEVKSIGTDAAAGAAYSLIVAVFMILVALEIPKIAGSIFGSGGGVSGSGPMRLAAKFAMKGIK